mgnify:CR=1 FL=1
MLSKEERNRKYQEILDRLNLKLEDFPTIESLSYEERKGLIAICVCEFTGGRTASEKAAAHPCLIQRFWGETDNLRWYVYRLKGEA